MSIKSATGTEGGSDQSQPRVLVDASSLRALFLAERERRQTIRGQLSAPISIITFAAFGYVSLGSELETSSPSLLAYLLMAGWATSFLLVVTAVGFLVSIEMQYMRHSLSEFEEMTGREETEEDYFLGAYLALRDANRRAEKLRGIALMMLLFAMTIFLAAILCLPFA